MKDGSAGRAAHTSLRPGDSGYPRKLLGIHRPPDPLHVQGSFRDWERPCVAIVGSRAASSGGRRMARDLAADLSLRGFVIASGFARGIDGAAHEGALGVGGATLAVVGTGLDVIYPHEHETLRKAVMASGAMISEFPSGSPPRAYHFPRRNRILAGLCEAVVVVEAEMKSGALNTARWALDMGREVLAVPRSPWEPGSEGVNRLLRDGAAPAVDAEDVLAALGSFPDPPGGQDPSQRVLALLKASGSTGPAVILEELADLDPERLLSVLGRLEAMGSIVSGPKGYTIPRGIGAGSPTP